MKKTVSILIALTLVLSSLVCVSADEEYCTVNIAESAQAKLFASGEEIADEASQNKVNDYLANLNTGADRNNVVKYILSKDRIESAKSSDGYLHSVKKNVPFDISTDNEKNGLIFGGSSTSEKTVTVNADKPFSKIYLLYYMAGAKNTNIKVVYSDSSTESVSVASDRGAIYNDSQVAADEVNDWAPKISWGYNVKNTKTGSDYEFTYSDDAARYAPIIELNVSPLKKVKELKISRSDTWSTMALMAVTGKVATDEDINAVKRNELEAFLNKLPESEEDITKENCADVITVIDSIEAYDGYESVLTEEEMNKIAAFKLKANKLLNGYSEYIPVDISGSFNAKVFADEGKAIDDFDDVLKYISRYTNIDGKWVPRTDRAMNRNFFERNKKSDGFFYSNDGVRFLVDTTGGVVYGGRTTKLQDEKIVLDGVYANKLLFVIVGTKNTDKTRTNLINVEYYDGTVSKNTYEATEFINTKPDGDFITGSNISIKDKNGTLDAPVRYSNIVSVDTDYSKPIKSITFSTSDQYGGWAAIGVTAQVSEEDSAKKDIENKIDGVLNADISRIEGELNGIYKLVENYNKAFGSEPLKNYDKFIEIYNKYYQQAAKVESSSYKTRHDYTSAEIKFLNDMDEKSLLSSVLVEVNSKESKDYTVSYSDKLLTVKIKNDFEYNKNIKITVKSGAASVHGMALADDYSVSFAEEMPVGFSKIVLEDENGKEISDLKGMKGKTVTLKINFKNYTVSEGQDYLISVICSDKNSRLKKSYTLKGILAEGETLYDEFVFETEDESETIEVFALDSIDSLKTIAKEYKAGGNVE